MKNVHLKSIKILTGKLIVILLINALYLLNISLLQASKPDSSEDIKTIKILTIGNSFANNACAYLEEITESIDGCQIVIEKANIGGASLEKHANLIEACDKMDINPYQKKFCLIDLLKKRNYDFITIQQVSHLSFKSESYQPFGDKLFKFIRQHAAKAEVIIHQTWAYAPGCKRLEYMEISRDEMHNGLVSSYINFAKKLNLDILPSGSAFYESFQKNPNINLWQEDGFHANMNGRYLAGCTWFGKFFEISPAKIRFNPEEMDKKTAKFLRNIAANQLFSNKLEVSL